LRRIKSLRDPCITTVFNRRLNAGSTFNLVGNSPYAGEKFYSCKLYESYLIT
jgi:hypothetical protein